MGVATVAVLFSDLVESTATAERLGPAASDRARRDHFAALRTAVQAHRGIEVKSTGDGLMVVFASPSDAVACAAAMQVAHDAASGRAIAPAPGSAMRVGVSVGEATEEDGDWFGLPVVRAARLCDAAPGGEVYVDRLVAALAARASTEFEPVGELDLKGLAQPVEVLRLQWEPTTAPIPLQPMLASVPPAGFVGRADELDALRGAWGRAAEGRTVLAMVGGEPGAGKTSLAARLAHELRADADATALVGRCSDAPGLAYQPFVQAVGHYLRHADDAVVAEHVTTHGGELRRLSDDLLARVPDAPSPVVADPATEQWRLFEAVRGLLAAAGRRTPVLLVLDDLHWASAPALHLLRHLVEADEPAPLLVVATYRETELSRTLPLADALAELRRVPSVERVPIGGLDLAGTTALVERIAGHDLDDEGRAFAGEVHRRTEGNPFFVTEVLRHLAESGALVQREGRWSADRLDLDSLPEGVKEVVGRRLRRLSVEANRVLVVAAVVGLEFDGDVVATVLGCEPGELLDPLDEARRAGVVREVLPARFAFTHGLIRSTVRDEAGLSRLVDLHARVASAIEQLHGHDLDPWLAELAYHHGEAAHATRTAPAVAFAHRAAAQACRRAAVDEAVAILERGLDAARLAEPADDRAVAGLAVALAEATAMSDPLRARAWVEEAVEAAQRAAAPDLVVAAVASLWSVFNTTLVGSVGGDRWLLDLCRQALAADDGRAEPAARARVLALDVLLCWWLLAEPPDLGRAEEALALATAGGDPVAAVLGAQARLVAQAAIDPRAVDWPGFLAVVDRASDDTDDEYVRGMAAVFLSWAASGVGDRARFDESARRIERAASILSTPRMPTWTRWLRAMTALRAGRWDDALVESAAAAETSIDRIIGESVVALHGALVLVQRGTVDAGIGLAEYRAENRAEHERTIARALWAVLHALDGDDDASRTEVRALLDEGRLAVDPMASVTLGLIAHAVLLSRSSDLAPEVEALLLPYEGLLAAGGMAELASVDRLLGGLAALGGRHVEADGRFRTGLALEESFGGVAMAAHTRYWWAASLLERDGPGDADRAAALLDECLATAVHLDMVGLVAAARRLR